MVTMPRSQKSWTADERQSGKRLEIPKMTSGVFVQGADSTEHNVSDVLQGSFHPQDERLQIAARRKQNGIAAEKYGESVSTELSAAEQYVDIYTVIYLAFGNLQAVRVE